MYHHAKQFTHNWHLPCCQCTGTSSHAFLIKKIYMIYGTQTWSVNAFNQLFRSYGYINTCTSIDWIIAYMYSWQYRFTSYSKQQDNRPLTALRKWDSVVLRMSRSLFHCWWIVASHLIGCKGYPHCPVTTNGPSFWESNYITALPQYSQ